MGIENIKRRESQKVETERVVLDVDSIVGPEF
jgi:hypothetical protein